MCFDAQIASDSNASSFTHYTKHWGDWRMNNAVEIEIYSIATV